MQNETTLWGRGSDDTEGSQQTVTKTSDEDRARGVPAREAGPQPRRNARLRKQWKRNGVSTRTGMDTGHQGTGYRVIRGNLLG